MTVGRLQYPLHTNMNYRAHISGCFQVDQYYLSQRSERMRLLQQRLAVEEQSAVARMIEKHSEEMLELIADLVKSHKICLLTRS